MNGKVKNKFKKQMFVHAKNLETDAPNSAKSTSSSFADPAQYMVNGELLFRIPPEAPVFTPSKEEFLDPLAYIHSIKPIAERCGICKVKPPANWQPPFSVDVDRFKFTPRIQKLNELDANTRVKMYFLERLSMFWSFKGQKIKIPLVNDKILDMYSLYKIVESEGGFEAVNAEKKWCLVARRMGFVNEKAIAPTLRFHYKRLLFPYEEFNLARKEEAKEVQNNNNNNNKTKNIERPRKQSAPPAEYSSSNSNNNHTNGNSNCNSDNNNSGSNINGSSKRRTRSNYTESDTEILVSETFKNPVIQDKNKELQRLTFYGPGPKILGNSKKKGGGSLCAESIASSSKDTDIDANELVSDYRCVSCNNGQSEESILLCDDCDSPYHTFCLVPPLNSIPKGNWRCPKCIAAAVTKLNDTFGFEQAEREYTLQQFGEMADQFKSNYFKMPVHMVPTEMVEREYWRILSSLDSSVSVEYGADLHSMDHGSGFPTYLALKECGEDDDYYRSYVESSWNLNNIPVLEGSVLGYINADISGMKIPWMYVGMCFSTFCWHNEDHWSYSINYLHWGEPKTWYGVPGSSAEEFERVMQDTTPDLFYNQPDLLHQLVTILNPNILMDKGVPVYHIDQAAGEFVLTFPRAYHAGFNHGYNFAEAVNFAPNDWIPLGRLCVDHYSSLHRYCVFSHDELICKMASLTDKLSSSLAMAAYDDMVKMLEVENRQRKALLEWGVVTAEREAFELIQDDERQCSECNTTCFLSAVTCKCTPNKLVCLRHYQSLCSCPPVQHTLRYRYTLDELPMMLEKLKEHAESASLWVTKVHEALNVSRARTMTLSGLRTLLEEARHKKFPDDNRSVQLLERTIKSVEDALTVDFETILTSKSAILPNRLKVVEIEHYYNELKRIPCILPQESVVSGFLEFAREYKERVRRVLDSDSSSVEDLERLMAEADFANIEMDEVRVLQTEIQARQWLNRCNSQVINTNGRLPRTKSLKQWPMPPLTLERLDELIASGKDVDHLDKVTEKLDQLFELRETMIQLEETSKYYLAARSSPKRPRLSDLHDLLQAADKLNVALSKKRKIVSLIEAATRWRQIANDVLNNGSLPPFLHYVENVIRGACDNINFDEMTKLQTMVADAQKWKRRVRSHFLPEQSPLWLLDVIVPRKEFPSTPSADNGTGEHMLNVNDMFKHLRNIERSDLWEKFRKAEKREMELILSHRVNNVYKRTNKRSTYCVCRCGFSVNLKECVLCRNLYHPRCCLTTDIDCCPKNEHELVSSSFSKLLLCPFCKRSKRPPLETVTRELKSLTALSVRLMEGEALRRLAERTSEWITEVESVLAGNNEIASAVNIVRTLQQETSSVIGNASPQIGFVKLKEENRCVLKKLLIRGNVLEVDLPQNELIYKLLQCSQLKTEIHSDTNENDSVIPSLFDADSLNSELSYETFYFKSELLAPDVTNNTTIALNSNNKGQKRKSETGTAAKYDKAVNETNISVGKNRSAKPQTRRTCKKSNMEPKRKQTFNNILITSDDTAMSDDDGEEETGKVCDVRKCLQPDSDYVDWVQCDLCKNWLHMICVGVTRTQMETQTEFLCAICCSKVSRKSDNPILAKFRDSPENVICVD